MNPKKFVYQTKGSTDTHKYDCICKSERTGLINLLPFKIS